MAPKRTVREGLMAGLIGAAAVAFWFFLVDMVAGRPLHTPIALGQALQTVLGVDTNFSVATYVIGYSVLHLAVFLLIGLVLGVIIQASNRSPGVLAGLLILFAVFEMGFYFVTAFLAQPEAVGRIAWYQVGAANLLAASLMGWYMLRKHPELKARMSEALEGTTST